MPRWAVAHLFEVRNRLSLNWGGYVYGHDSSVENYWERSEMEISLDLCAQIERSALSTLRGLSVWMIIFNLSRSTNLDTSYLNGWTQKSSSMSRLATCNRRAISGIRKKEGWSADRPRYDAEDRAKYARLRLLGEVLDAGKRNDLINLLHSWETQSVRNLKLEKIWKPTPFPLELNR